MDDFVVKMDAEKKVMQSGMTREDKSSKLRFDLIPDFMLWRLAALYTKGAKNHAPRNWEKASTEEDFDLFMQGAYRHFMQYRRGDRDEDHVAAVFFNLAGAELVREKLNANR